jgi:hypothetical protein
MSNMMSKALGMFSGAGSAASGIVKGSGGQAANQMMGAATQAANHSAGRNSLPGTAGQKGVENVNHQSMLNNETSAKNAMSQADRQANMQAQEEAHAGLLKAQLGRSSMLSQMIANSTKNLDRYV